MEQPLSSSTTRLISARELQKTTRMGTGIALMLVLIIMYLISFGLLWSGKFTDPDSTFVIVLFHIIVFGGIIVWIKDSDNTDWCFPIKSL